jgi:TPR repeat protein
LSLAAPVAAGPFEDAVTAVRQNDYDTAVRLFRPLAEHGDTRAEILLGFWYGKGQGVPQDFAESVKWWRLAADQGHARAQFALGLMYAEGHGVPQDSVLAYMWFELSAAQHEIEAAKKRDMLAQRMTPPQIAEAQKLAREWKPTKQRPISTK